MQNENHIEGFGTFLPVWIPKGVMGLQCSGKQRDAVHSAQAVIISPLYKLCYQETSILFVWV